MPAAALQTLRRSSITARMVLLVVLVVAVASASIGTLSYVRAQDALESAARSRLELQARDMARNLHGELLDRVADITSWAHLETMMGLVFADVDKELAELLGHAVADRRAYRALAAYDRHGTRVAVGGAGADLPETMSPISGARLRILESGRGAEAAILPAFLIEMPVRDARDGGAPLGMLAGALDAGPLRNAVAGGVLPGDVTVAVLAGGTSAGVPSHPAAILEATSPVPALMGVSAPALQVVVRQPRRAALAHVLALRRSMVRVALLVLILSVAVGGLVAWRISAPVRALTAAVQAVTARGRPEPLAELPIVDGEVGLLTTAFQAMLERLTIAQREAIAQSRLALLGEVAASIAHDVRTPLSVLKTSAQLMAGTDVSPAERQDLGRMISQEVDRLNGVVTNLVDLARPRPARPAERDVPELIESAAAVLRPWAGSLGVTIVGDAPPNLRAHVDRDQMQQVLLNLIHNAVQASPRPGRVVVRGRAETPWVRLAVQDAGPGFTPEALERGFSSFFTTKADGVGLGLASVKRLVEEQGGTVGANNVAMGGAVVWIRVPQTSEFPA